MVENDRVENIGVMRRKGVVTGVMQDDDVRIMYNKLTSK